MHFTSLLRERCVDDDHQLSLLSTKGYRQRQVKVLSGPHKNNCRWNRRSCRSGRVIKVIFPVSGALTAFLFFFFLLTDGYRASSGMRLLFFLSNR
jgi:hypothetical protein